MDEKIDCSKSYLEKYNYQENPTTVFKKAQLLSDRLTSPSHTCTNTRLIGTWRNTCSTLLRIKEMQILRIRHNFFNLQIGTDQKVLNCKR